MTCMKLMFILSAIPSLLLAQAIEIEPGEILPFEVLCEHQNSQQALEHVPCNTPYTCVHGFQHEACPITRARKYSRCGICTVHWNFQFLLNCKNHPHTNVECDEHQ
ncbi:hypothetical protein PGTUg99_035823 [Puccinia graminis f. sp. tritici]|uniref:Secreted protein n=1 Tax=Puccinia graminis f. sp. tritici TaxID=56615 RepID=A0A5B0RP02_PUCGR|nr:hypothetical protein PGTUg99_035823 [Puccinia graminis f. sp. tritici]